MPALGPVRRHQLAAKFAPSPFTSVRANTVFSSGETANNSKSRVRCTRRIDVPLEWAFGAGSRPSHSRTARRYNWYLEHALSYYYRCRNLLRHARQPKPAEDTLPAALGRLYRSDLGTAPPSSAVSVPFHRSCLPHRVRRAQADGARCSVRSLPLGRGAPTRMPSWPASSPRPKPRFRTLGRMTSDASILLWRVPPPTRAARLEMMEISLERPGVSRSISVSLRVFESSTGTLVLHHLPRSAW